MQSIESQKAQSIQFKSIIDDIINRDLSLFNDDVLRVKVNEFTSKNYNIGLLEAEKNADMNFLPIDRNLQSLSNYSFSLIKDVTEDMESQLRKSLQEGLLNRESITEIKNRIKAIFRGKDLKVVEKTGNIRTIDWRNRLNMIVRTESNRAENQGHFDGVIQSRIEMKKYVDVFLDSRTSPICRAMHKKYGTQEQAIPMDEDFVATVGGKEYSFRLPPFHVNCRTVALFVPIEDL